MPAKVRFFHKYRFLKWLILAYLKKHALFILVGISLGVVLGLKSRDLYLLLSPQTDIERIGIIGNYTQNSLPLEIQNLVSFGLTSVNSQGKLEPKAALKYEVKDGGKTYLFTLRKNLLWQDGKPLTVSDINYTFKDVKITTDNKNTIKFQLSEPFSPFPSLVVQPLFRKGLLGLGDYKMTGFEEEGKFISRLVLEKPKKKLVFKFYTTSEEGLIGYKLGEINTLWGLNNPQNLKDLKNTRLIASPQTNRYVALFFNNKEGYFQEKTFRQALSYALEDKYIKEKKVYTPISPSSWAYNPNVKQYDYNLVQANKLFTKIVSASDSASLKIHLTAIKPYDTYAGLIADSWKKLGIETKIETVSFPPARYEVLLAAQEIPLDPDQYFLWHSTSRLNITGYNSKRIDKLLEDGRQTVDQEKRKQIYYDFQKYIIEDRPAIFLYHPVTYTITRN